MVDGTDIRSEGISSLGEPVLGGIGYVPVRKKAKSSIQLKKGEIIAGTIMDNNGQNQVVVRLPMGTYNAFLRGRLKKGDYLFLKVIENTPSLMLKIHSVYTHKNRKPIPDDEILRILDLPDSKFYKELLRVIRKFESRIVRDSILLIVKDYLGLIEQKVRVEKHPEATKAIYFMRKHGMKLSPENFEDVRMLFVNPNVFLNSVLNIEKFTLRGNKNFPVLKNILKSIHSNIYNVKSMMYLFSSSGVEEGKLTTFYEIIRKHVIGNSVFALIINDARIIKSSFDALYKWNEFALNNDAPFFAYLPFPVKGRLEIARILMLRPDNKMNKNIRMSLKVPGFTEKENEYLELINSEFRKKGFILENICLSNGSESSFDPGANSSGARLQSISVVV